MTITIAHINVAKGYRGGERQTELLIRELEKADLKQRLISRRGGSLAPRLEDIALEVRPTSGNPISVANACRGVDIVHSHEGRSVYGAFLNSLISGTPYVLTRRVNNPVRNHWLAHQTYSRASTVAAVAPQVAEVMVEFDPKLKPVVVHSSSSGLEVNPSISGEIKRAYAGKCLVGHVGALDNEQKGQEFIIQVAKDLQSSHPDIHFLLVGGGEDEKMLKSAALGLRNLSFAGFVDNVGDYLAAFDMFILPSRKEGIGSILLDAMDQGLPVIASRVGGVPEIVHDGKNGILIDSENPAQLKAAILKLLGDSALRAELGSSGRELAKNYTAEVMSRKYLEIYESALASR